MTPILYESTEKVFKSNGIRRLTNIIDCTVTEERNGAYTLSLSVATTTPYFNELKEGRLIGVKVADGTRQAFEIYQITRPIDQIVKVLANHISYRASYIPVVPFIANGITQTLEGLSNNVLLSNPFTLETDFENETTTYNQSTPKSLRACLGGTQGSVLDTFSGGGAGEYLFDNYTIKFLQHRGADRGAFLRYRKNITEFEQTKSIDELVTGVLPYWTNAEGTVVFIGEIQYSPDHEGYDFERVIPLDLSAEFETAPTENMLNSAGLEYITNTSTNKPRTNITLSFVDLQYVNEPIYLCDTVHVIYRPLDVKYTAKVIRTTWNVITEKYAEIEIGEVKSDIAKTIRTAQGDISELITTGKRMISITQEINREIGYIQSTVASVQTITDGLTETIQTQQAQITQQAEAIELSVLQKAVAAAVEASGERIAPIENHVIITAEDTRFIGNDPTSYTSIKDNRIAMIVKNQEQFKVTPEGVVANSYIAGDWHIQPSNNGYTLDDFRKVEK